MKLIKIREVYMSSIILRRRKLGRTSCREVSKFMKNAPKVVRSDRPIPDNDLTIRWGCTANTPAKNVLNTAAAIHEVNDKVNFRLKMDTAELCPATYTAATLGDAMRLEQPLVVRPARHSRGRRLYVARNAGELLQYSRRCGEGWYASPLINKVAEYRVFVVSGRAVAVAKKTPGNPDDVAWNVAEGGRFDNVNWDNWPLKAVKTAIAGFELSSLDFGGVDVMVDGNGEVYILEINSAPSLTSPYRQECMAKAFDYIIENGKERIPLQHNRGGYTKFIHPAVCDRAKFAEV
jgi:glutathione synthase/RimK-type ligase-like ATP-grasp enzyme